MFSLELYCKGLWTRPNDLFVVRECSLIDNACQGLSEWPVVSGFFFLILRSCFISSAITALLKGNCYLMEEGSIVEAGQGAKTCVFYVCKGPAVKEHEEKFMSSFKPTQIAKHSSFKKPNLKGNCWVIHAKVTCRHTTKSTHRGINIDDWLISWKHWGVSMKALTSYIYCIL